MHEPWTGLEPRRFILTGAPGSGKTAILRRLRERGWPVVDEAATEVIAREQTRGIDEPWTAPEFVSAIAALQRERRLEPVPAARRISYRDSLEFEAVNEQVYAEHGFTLVDVPAAGIAERAAFIEARVVHCDT